MSARLSYYSLLSIRTNVSFVAVIQDSEVLIEHEPNLIMIFLTSYKNKNPYEYQKNEREMNHIFLSGERDDLKCNYILLIKIAFTFLLCTLQKCLASLSLTRNFFPSSYFLVAKLLYNDLCPSVSMSDLG